VTRPQAYVLAWEMKAEGKVWRDLREGAYLLRTNLQADSAEEMWSKYMLLTEAEASFRAPKRFLSGLCSIRRRRRVKAHVLVAFLGYILWVTLKYLLKRRPAIVPRPRTAQSTTLSRSGPRRLWLCRPHCRAPTSSFPRRTGARSDCAGSRNLHLDRNPCSTNLDSACPKPLKSLSKRSADSAIA
jgi:hypothetical protein